MVAQSVILANHLLGRICDSRRLEVMRYRSGFRPVRVWHFVALGVLSDGLGRLGRGLMLLG